MATDRFSKYPNLPATERGRIKRAGGECLRCDKPANRSGFCSDHDGSAATKPVNSGKPKPKPSAGEG